jgi:hypothetical protein
VRRVADESELTQPRFCGVDLVGREALANFVVQAFVVLVLPARLRLRVAKGNTEAAGGESEQPEHRSASGCLRDSRRISVNQRGHHTDLLFYGAGQIWCEIIALLHANAYRDMSRGARSGAGRKPTSCSSVAKKYGILFLRRIWLLSALAVLRICAVCSWVRPRA